MGSVSATLLQQGNDVEYQHSKHLEKESSVLVKPSFCVRWHGFEPRETTERVSICVSMAGSDTFPERGKATCRQSMPQRLETKPTY